jgi:hypothetical protein
MKPGIDYDILWPSEKNRRLLSSRQIFSVSRLLQNAGHTVIRPRIIQIPVLDYFSMLFTYTFEIFRQIDEFKPDVLYLDTILSAYLASRLAKLKNIKIIYYCIDTCYRLLPYKFLQSLGKLIESRTIKAADLVFSINVKLREFSIRFGYTASKTIFTERC